MAKIIVKAVSDSTVLVNKKAVYKDMNNQWVACSELSLQEQEVFRLYKNTVIEAYGKPTGKMEYTIKNGIYNHAT